MKIAKWFDLRSIVNGALGNLVFFIAGITLTIAYQFYETKISVSNFPTLKKGDYYEGKYEYKGKPYYENIVIENVNFDKSFSGTISSKGNGEAYKYDFYADFFDDGNYLWVKYQTKDKGEEKDYGIGIFSMKFGITKNVVIGKSMSLDDPLERHVCRDYSLKKNGFDR